MRYIKSDIFYLTLGGNVKPYLLLEGKILSNLLWYSSVWQYPVAIQFIDTWHSKNSANKTSWWPQQTVAIIFLPTIFGYIFVVVCLGDELCFNCIQMLCFCIQIQVSSPAIIHFKCSVQTFPSDCHSLIFSIASVSIFCST